MRFLKKEIRKEKLYGGKEKAGKCVFQRKIVTVQNDTFLG